jgi:hypothetical protein
VSHDSKIAMNNFPNPGRFLLGSPESRAAARAMADAKREPPKVIVWDCRHSDGKLVRIDIYGTRYVEREM